MVDLDDDYIDQIERNLRMASQDDAVLLARELQRRRAASKPREVRVGDMVRTRHGAVFTVHDICGKVAHWAGRRIDCVSDLTILVPLADAGGEHDPDCDVRPAVHSWEAFPVEGADGSELTASRLRVYGGWIVDAAVGVESAGVFVPDSNHEWEVAQ